jgi:hypothetical protein
VRKERKEEGKEGGNEGGKEGRKNLSQDMMFSQIVYFVAAQ